MLSVDDNAAKNFILTSLYILHYFDTWSKIIFTSISIVSKFFNTSAKSFFPYAIMKLAKLNVKISILND